MKRFRVEVYGRHKLESAEWGRVKVKEFFVSVWDYGYDVSTKEPSTPITTQDRNVSHQLFDEHTTIITERFFFRPLTEYRVTREP